MNTRITIALLVAGGVLGRAAIAHACGGGGSDSSGSSDSSSSSSSSSSDYGSSTYVAEPACVDATDVHGYRTCSDYGAWSLGASLPAISFELATWSAQVDLRDIDVSGNMHHSYGDDYTYRVVGDDLGGEALAVGAKVRILGHQRRGLYGGLEGGLAGVASDPVAPMASAEGTAMLSPRVSSMFILGAVVGVEHGVGRLTLGGEVLTGVRGVNVTAESQRGACETTETQITARGLIEARLRADVWVTPWLTVGAYAGRDVFGAQTSAGLGLGGHLRAFDGAR